MFTKNWYKLYAVCAFTKSQSVNPFGAIDVNNQVKELYNHDVNSDMAMDIYTYVETILTTLTTSDIRGVAFGTGDTTPTPDDYKLAGSTISSLSGSVAKNVSVDEDGTTLTAIYTLTNSGTEDVTVREIGLFNIGYYSKLKYSTSFLLDRTVLDAPVTIPAGGIGQVTYTIRLNYPT